MMLVEIQKIENENSFTKAFGLQYEECVLCVFSCFYNVTGIRLLWIILPKKFKSFSKNRYRDDVQHIVNISSIKLFV